MIEEKKENKKSNGVKKIFAYHPLLVALAPIISFYDHNKDIASSAYLIKPLLISLVVSAIVFFILNLFIKNHKKSALVVSSYIILFFLYSSYAELFKFVDSKVDYNSLAIVVSIFLCLGILFLVAKSNKNFDAISKYLNIFSLIIVLMPISSIGYYNYSSSQNKNLPVLLEEGKNEEENTTLNKPDIYYIILDGYARQDVLKELYNYDNSDFTNWLKNQGFFVAEKSTSNYIQTYLSMTSSLNIDYLDKLTKIELDSTDRKWLKEKLKNNYVYDFLKAKNYTFVGVPPTWTGNYDNVKADIEVKHKFKNNDFDILIINSTPLRIFINKESILKDYKEKIEFTFNELQKISLLEQNTFIYAHFLMPHPPFVFYKNGDLKNDIGCGKDGNHYFQDCPGEKNYKQGYIDQLQYTNTKVKETVEYILENSKEEPIIILQSDHGPGSMLDWESLEKTNLNERFPILNAYYVPTTTKELLSEDVTPINSFRIIFNSVFNNDFEILGNKHYFSTWTKPYKFIEVSDKLKSN